MKTPLRTLLIGFTACLLFAATLACGAGAVTAPTALPTAPAPTPTLEPTLPTGPKPGHWEGTAPYVSFDVTEQGKIVNFALNAPFVTSTCYITIQSITVADNAFLVDAETFNESTFSMGIFVVTGQFDGESATGTHTVEFCGQTVSYSPQELDWQASWVGAATAPEPAATTASQPTLAPGAETYLSVYDPSAIFLGYGEYSVGTFKFSAEDPADNVHYGDPIAMHGVEYAQGIFAHAPSYMVYTLGNHPYTEFAATLGLLEHINCGDGVQFLVFLDGVEVYRSETLYSWSDPVTMSVSIAGSSELMLAVDSLSNNECDWAIWGDPILR